ncbi:hypothetical protein NCCP2716_27700 [Sporosarcina sp. NCCP-2716]|uniref:hypothetical protein n=1 Tax=Sporosarcina sp. NCCP-2716 TaxID=2943679 RepID=UPI00203D82F6|nr:hypothetical protein [Sporosarcina sp. NCCP-2716]GKV70272.1 hypothetical protein NCCP2716_27700 [Sporosarcina sp. NCCP-2716]
MSRYRKKQVVVEAVQFNGENHREILSFIYPDLTGSDLSGAERMRLPIVIETLEGTMTVREGDFVIKGVQGEFYPCKPDIFRQTYELVEGNGCYREG